MDALDLNAELISRLLNAWEDLYPNEPWIGPIQALERMLQDLRKSKVITWETYYMDE